MRIKSSTIVYGVLCYLALFSFLRYLFKAQFIVLHGNPNTANLILVGEQHNARQDAVNFIEELTALFPPHILLLEGVPANSLVSCQDHLFMNSPLRECYGWDDQKILHDSFENQDKNMAKLLIDAIQKVGRDEQKIEKMLEKYREVFAKEIVGVEKKEVGTQGFSWKELDQQTKIRILEALDNIQSWHNQGISYIDILKKYPGQDLVASTALSDAKFLSDYNQRQRSLVSTLHAFSHARTVLLAGRAHVSLRDPRLSESIKILQDFLDTLPSQSYAIVTYETPIHSLLKWFLEKMEGQLIDQPSDRKIPKI